MSLNPRFQPTTSLPTRVTLALRMIATFRGAFLAGRHGQPGLSPREGAMYLAAVEVVRLYMCGEHDFADAAQARSSDRQRLAGPEDEAA
jgi:hypothetical protein